jgi:hypothetical protein
MGDIYSVGGQNLIFFRGQNLIFFVEKKSGCFEKR